MCSIQIDITLVIHPSSCGMELLGSMCNVNHSWKIIHLITYSCHHRAVNSLIHDKPIPFGLHAQAQAQARYVQFHPYELECILFKGVFTATGILAWLLDEKWNEILYHHGIIPSLCIETCLTIIKAIAYDCGGYFTQYFHLHHHQLQSQLQSKVMPMDQHLRYYTIQFESKRFSHFCYLLLIIMKRDKAKFSSYLLLW